MAHTTSSPQIPQHVHALLSHLTSRPGVQSTLILSRKDGSIIQTTGLLASSSESTETPTLQRSAQASTSTISTTATEATETGTDAPSDPSPTTVPLPESSSVSPTPYRPSHAEALAAHIFAFVCSASDLSSSLSNMPSRENGSVSAGVNGERVDDTAVNHGTRAEEEAERHEREDEDDVKLLRFRSRKHEVVVVPDKKYILCVVHDAAGGSESAGGGPVRSSR